MRNRAWTSRRSAAAAAGALILATLVVSTGAGAQVPASPGDEELLNLEHVFNFNPRDHDPQAEDPADEPFAGSDLEFFSHTVPLRDYETGGLVDEAGEPVTEPVMAERDFAVVGSYQRGGYVFDITDPEHPQFVSQVTCRQNRNDVGIKKLTDPETGETTVVLALTQQTGIPCADQAGGVGVQVNDPPELEGFLPANQWVGTADVDDETADLVFAGPGCTPADYVGADVDGKIALVSQSGDVAIDVEDVATVRECPAATFFQKMQLAEAAGAIGLVQVRNDDVQAGRTAVSSGIPGLELTNTDGGPILEAVIDGAAVNVTLTVGPSDARVIGEGSGGIGVFDITDPYEWEPMYRLVTGFGGVHNFVFHPSEPVGYVSNGALPGAVNSFPIIDFTDLDNPTLSAGPETVGGPHDAELSPDGSRIYVASENNYQIYDNTDPLDPQLISMAPNVGSYAHGVFPSPDLSLMVTNNESITHGGFLAPGACPGEGLASYDISNEEMPVGPLGYYVPNVAGPVAVFDDDLRPCTSHFGRFAPGTNVMSIGWYIAGVRIIDWSDPTSPTEVAAAVMENTNTWAAKFHKGPYVYAGDIDRGFDVFRWSGDGPAPWEPGNDAGDGVTVNASALPAAQTALAPALLPGIAGSPQTLRPATPYGCSLTLTS